MTGPDNEAASGNNHVRYIRTDAGSTNYTMPMDVWINTNPGAQHEESELGGLTALPSTPGNVQIDWQGLKCASMQTTTNVTSGPWMDLFDAQGVGSTNLQTTEGQQFFRMFRP
jgi:hypothetical protein